MEWMIIPLRRYADFAGRSPRIEVFMFQFTIILAMTILFCLVAIIGEITGNFVAPLAILSGFFWLAFFVPSLALLIRRFHDQDRSGWLVLLGMVPFAGGIILLVFMLLEGTSGPNRFGPEPLGLDWTLGNRSLDSQRAS